VLEDGPAEDLNVCRLRGTINEAKEEKIDPVCRKNVAAPMDNGGNAGLVNIEVIPLKKIWRKRWLFNFC